MLPLSKAFLTLLIICFSLFASTFAVDKDPFVLIPNAIDNYSGKVDQLTDPNTQAGREFWNAYNVFGDGYAGKKDSSAQF